MPTGIFNPFDKTPAKKPDYKNPLNADPRDLPGDTLYPKIPRKIILDGDTYSLEFNNVDSIDDVRRVLIEMLYDVNSAYENLLSRNGIRMTGPDDPVNLSLGEQVFATPTGKLIVYAGEFGTEIDIYRRLGYALRSVNPKLLDKHGVRVNMRG